MYHVEYLSGSKWLYYATAYGSGQATDLVRRLREAGHDARYVPYCASCGD
jgi:hypothetical protein